MMRIKDFFQRTADFLNSSPRKTDVNPINQAFQITIYPIQIKGLNFQNSDLSRQGTGRFRREG
jgi:hypothetical protein